MDKKREEFIVKKSVNLKHAGVAFLCGSLFFSGLAAAQPSAISVSMEKLRFIVHGTDRAPADNKFDNAGQQVPASIVYKGTTYVPIRLAADLLDQPVHWDGTTQSIWLGEEEVPLVKADGTVIGHAMLSQGDKGVNVHVEVSQLTPGKHGFHLHEKNFDNNDFKTAGGHFNPESHKHGHDNPDGSHAGDLPNIEVGANGTGHAEFTLEGLTLDRSSANSVWGKSLIIHAAEDDYKTDPSGNSGDRIAGGNIR
uniref:Superoxide dismutase n=1 Tax=Cohnella candidum TaxID=2674991 RepID=A0A3G3K394_9BACL|nr:superoxide dismutase [Cohnella candidum]